MFRELRRKNQLLSEKESIDILNRNTSGTLACIGDNDYPYAVPLSYVYSDGKIYFHCAVEGHKLDAIKCNSKVSFCVIDTDDVLPEKFTTRYRSVIAFGNARIIEDDNEKRKTLEILARKYSPNDDAAIEKEINAAIDRTCMVEIDIEYMTGKEGIEFTRLRNS